MTRQAVFADAAVIITIALLLYGFESIYSSPAITGYATEMPTMAFILQLNETICNFTLQDGWNLVSIPCIPVSLAPSEIFSNINASLVSVHAYFAKDTGDPWKAYNPSLPSWVVQDLQLVNRKEGYWINVNRNVNYLLYNATATPNLIDLNPGWNLVGYPVMNPKEINDSLSSIYPYYSLVVIYNSSDSLDHWKEYSWNSTYSAINDLNYTFPYFGYWIHMNESAMWSIN
jgi:hypothetical protein